MVENKNKCSVAIVKENGVKVGYLSQRAINNGYDVYLDMQGYTIESL